MDIPSSYQTPHQILQDNRFSGKAATGPYTDEPGLLDFNKICESNRTPAYDDYNKAPYVYSGN